MAKITWEEVRLLDATDQYAPEFVTIDDTLRLLKDGGCVVDGRFFKGPGFWASDPIDFEFNGECRAFRARGSKQLVIRTAGPDRQTLVYEWQALLFGLISVGWVQLVPRVH